MSHIHIRECRGPREFPRLVQVWRTSVDATHDFLKDEHRDAIEQRLASDYFPNVNLIVAEIRGEIVGFAGTSESNLEMLFVDANFRGEGVGGALLEVVVCDHGVQSVDVNEQNHQAVGFYLHSGFEVVGRSEVDGDGLPYPLLHMRLAGTHRAE